MMPDDVLSTYRVPSSFVGARALPVTAIVDYEDGGVALNDSSLGAAYQVWRARLIEDAVLLSAPNTPEFEWFTAPGLEEISFTFDQLMRPAVAFVQSGQAKLRWFDTVAGMQVITDLPVGAVTPRIVMDDKRATQSGSSDMILGYVLDGNLCMRMQRDRFLIEYVLEVGNQVGIKKIGFTSQLRLQFLMDPTGSTTRPIWPNSGMLLDPLSASWATASIVAEIALRAGVPAERINLDGLVGSVDGFSVLPSYAAFAAIESLARIRLFDAANWDGQLHFVPRGGAPIAQIELTDLVEEANTDIVKLQRRDSINVPRVLQLKYYDIDGALQPDMQTSDRSLDARSKSESSNTTTVLMRAQDAARTVVITHKVSIEEQRGEFTFSLPDSWLHLTPTDVVMLGTDRVRITECRIDNGQQKYKASFDRASAYTSTVLGVPAGPITTPPTLQVGDTVMHFIDSHIIRDSDDRLGYYVAVAGASDAWGGAMVELSLDGGATYTERSSSDARAYMGVLTTALGEHPVEYPDRQNTFQVQMLRTDMGLEDTTEVGMLNRANLAIVGDELINFATTDEVTPGVWDLSLLLRGRKGSEVPASHPIGTRFVMMDRSRLAFVDAELFHLGRELTFRVTTFRSSTSTTVTATYLGRSQLERAPAYLTVRREGVSMVIEWRGVGRLGGGSRVAMGAQFQYFEVSINGAIYYTSGQIVGVAYEPGLVTVRQINRLTGPGPAVSITVT